MGLYLCVFDGEEELDGVEVGPYAEFASFRESITKLLEAGIAGSRFPVLILHHDSDGEWAPGEAETLERELTDIREAFRQLPPIELSSDWQRQVAKNAGLGFLSLYDCFFDVDGEPLIDRLIGLAKLSQIRKLPIIFQ